MEVKFNWLLKLFCLHKISYQWTHSLMRGSLGLGASGSVITCTSSKQIYIINITLRACNRKREWINNKRKTYIWMQLERIEDREQEQNQSIKLIRVARYVEFWWTGSHWRLDVTSVGDMLWAIVNRHANAWDKHIDDVADDPADD